MPVHNVNKFYFLNMTWFVLYGIILLQLL